MRALLYLALTTAAAAEGYDFAPGKARFYDYILDQTVAWESADDRLEFVTSIKWRFALRGIAVDGPIASVNATYLRVTASHQGPGADHQVDSALVTTASDPVLGHLAAFEGVSLGLSIDQRTGTVTAVTGGERIIAALDARHPAAFPGDPPPLGAAARALYAPAALAAWWSQLLALPTAEAQSVPLAAPLAGTLVRTWTGSTYALALPAGQNELALALMPEPAAVTGVLREVAGSGSTSLTDGMPGAGTGQLGFTLGLTALTQPVVQRHRLTWRLVPYQAPPAP